VRHIAWCASHGWAKFKRRIAPMNLHVEERSHERPRDQLFASGSRPELFVRAFHRWTGSTPEQARLV
jgi:hypothetical protein